MAEEAAHAAATMRPSPRSATVRLASADAASLREAMSAAAAGKLAEAKAFRDKISDPAARKLVDWFLYRGGYGAAAEIWRLPRGPSAWPQRNLLTQRAEQALFNGAAGTGQIKAF